MLAVLTAVSLLISSWALYTRFNQTNALRTRNAQIWHAVICDIEQAVVIDRQLTLKRKLRFIKFYDRLLVRDAYAAPCNLKITRR